MSKTKTVAKSVTEKTTVVNINSPKAMATFAKELKGFVVQHELYTPIKAKNYVHVEGWQFAGASMGIFPVIKSLERIDTDDKTEVKYRAEVELKKLGDDTVVGYGIAICSNKEQKKKSFDEYAIASMAQTRAIGKAFRMTIGWVMKLAGYEATPAEEADDIEQDDAEQSVPEIHIEDVRLIVNTRLAAMPTPEKMKFVKDWAGTISDKKLTDTQYRSLFKNLPRKEAQ